ncbi:MAG: hypothetical protein ACRD12_03725 [Acidimicrobiales bacterium]
MGTCELLRGTTVYLSGPMDFVMCREEERANGWRSRVSDVLQSWGVRVLDPWFKPIVRSQGREYGIEDETTTEERQKWDFAATQRAAHARADVAGAFWPVMHLDLRMVDLSDFVVACCPTNLYSVGTPHEIVVARQQRKPVLLVSPPVRYPRWRELRQRLDGVPEMRALLDAVATEAVVKENPTGAPSQWYTSLVDTESFFDGFGWSHFRRRFSWSDSYLDERELPPNEPVRPLLPYLEEVHAETLRPQRWDRRTGRYTDNDDWLLLEAQAEQAEGKDNSGT